MIFEAQLGRGGPRSKRYLGVLLELEATSVKPPAIVVIIEGLLPSIRTDVRKRGFLLIFFFRLFAPTQNCLDP